MGTSDKDFVSQTTLLTTFDHHSLAEILRLEKLCFPETWQYDDAEKYYSDILHSPENISVFLTDNGDVVGYVLSRPHNLMVPELRGYDAAFGTSEIGRYYIETIQIAPEARGKGGAKQLLLAACLEAKNRGVSNFSIHARTVNGFSEKVKAVFDGGITLIRHLDSWKPADGEPYEYIEWSY